MWYTEYNLIMLSCYTHHHCIFTPSANLARRGIVIAMYVRPSVRRPSVRRQLFGFRSLTWKELNQRSPNFIYSCILVPRWCLSKIRTVRPFLTIWRPKNGQKWPKYAFSHSNSKRISPMITKLYMLMYLGTGMVPIENRDCSAIFDKITP